MSDALWKKKPRKVLDIIREDIGRIDDLHDDLDNLHETRLMMDAWVEKLEDALGDDTDVRKVVTKRADWDFHKNCWVMQDD